MGQPSIHPLWLRLIHWSNAAAVIILIMSGWRIYNATRFLGYRDFEGVYHRWVFPGDWTLGGWLGGAIKWHFAAMWILMANAVLYVALSLITKRWPIKFGGLTVKGFITDLWDAARNKLSHADISHYNSVQKVAYILALVDLGLLIASGLVLWKSVQFGWLRVLLGGYEAARYIHFYAMCFIVAFIAVHVVMALLVPKSIKAMLWGR